METTGAMGRAASPEAVVLLGRLSESSELSAEVTESESLPSRRSFSRRRFREFSAGLPSVGIDVDLEGGDETGESGRGEFSQI